MSTKELFLCGGGSNLILGTGTEDQIFLLKTPAANKFFHQIFHNCHFGVKRNHYSLRWICITHIWFPRVFHKGIIIFQGGLTKLNFLTKFRHLEKIVNLMKDLKYEHQSTFPCGGGPNLILGICTENKIFILRTPTSIKVFSSNLPNIVTLVKKKIITHPD